MGKQRLENADILADILRVGDEKMKDEKPTCVSLCLHDQDTVLACPLHVHTDPCSSLSLSIFLALAPHSHVPHYPLITPSLQYTGTRCTIFLYL